MAHFSALSSCRIGIFTANVLRVKQKIVTIGAGEKFQASLTSSVDRRWVGILSVPAGAFACALHETLEVDLLIVVLPLEDISEIVDRQ